MGVANRDYDNEIPGVTLKSTIPFSLSTFYEHMLFWCENNGYKPENGSVEGFETRYRERKYPGYTEWWVDWKMRKATGDKHIYHDMKVEIHIMNRVRTEMIKKGQKVKLDTGEINVRINSVVNVDAIDKGLKRDLFNHQPFSVLRKIFKLRTIKDTIDFWEDFAFAKQSNFVAMCRDLLNMDRGEED